MTWMHTIDTISISIKNKNNINCIIIITITIDISAMTTAQLRLEVFLATLFLTEREALADLIMTPLTATRAGKSNFPWIRRT